MDERVRRCWAKTRLHVWPERYALASLPLSLLPEAAALLAGGRGSFAALVVERDEVSLTLEEGRWQASALRRQARAEAGSLRAIMLDVNLELDLTGYLAPAAVRLAEAGVPLIPQCAFLKDHLLVQQEHLATAVRVLEDFIARCRQDGA